MRNPNPVPIGMRFGFLKYGGANGRAEVVKNAPTVGKTAGNQKTDIKRALQLLKLQGFYIICRKSGSPFRLFESAETGAGDCKKPFPYITTPDSFPSLWRTREQRFP